MATYFHGSSEIQAAGGCGDGLQTLILMNPSGYVGFSDTQSPPPGSNFVFLNSNTPGGGGPPSSLHSPHAPLHHQQQQFVGIPLSSATNPSSLSPQHDISGLHAFLPRVQYGIYGPAVDLGVAREVSRSQQGLSLSLSSQQQQQPSSFGPGRELPRHQPLVAAMSPAGGDEMRVSAASSSPASGISSNGVNGMQNVLLSSKYLKAAQELLDEVVNVGKGEKGGGDSISAKGADEKAKSFQEPSPEMTSAGEGQGGKETGGGKRAGELTTAERQEFQMKKAKLVNMLDEVEQRYRQYHHQMQIVNSWFEQAGGIGSARTYTALALQTISKQFRCLKDAIVGQIRAARKSLGEEDGIGGNIDGSRLKYVDNQLRQQRALQQLGMIQHNAWRPQRGLPERSVSVLRAWLFEHFLHPYPKDSDKIMLAKQTGLTRSQVSNWFINARVRLWKPMVEEMYSEEMKEQENNGTEEKSSKSEEKPDSLPKTTAPTEKTSTLEIQNKGYVLNYDPPIKSNMPSPISASPETSPAGINMQNQSSFNLIGSPEMESMNHGSPKKQRSAGMFHSPSGIQSINMDSKASDLNSEHLSMKFDTDRQSREAFSLMGGPTNFIGGFGSYPIAELGRYTHDQFSAPYSGNGVSLTLGLPHCENISIPGTHQTYLPNQNMQLGRVEIGDTNEYGSINTPTSSHSTSVYESINIQNRKRFAAQLLPDFVA